jgi:hypothetical protein
MNKYSKRLSQLTEFYLFLTQKIVTKLSEIWVGPEIWDPEKNYPRSRIEGSKKLRNPVPGSGFRNTESQKGMGRGGRWGREDREEEGKSEESEEGRKCEEKEERGK